MNEAHRQQIIYEVLKSLCASNGALDYTPRALVSHAVAIVEELGNHVTN
jgi:hypothetical protein